MIPRFAAISDVGRVWEICSHPEVRKWTALSADVPFDAGRWFKGNAKVVLMDGGCALLNWLGAGTYGIHLKFLPGSRGKNAICESSKGLALLFLGSDVESILATIPSDNPAVRWFAGIFGFRPRFIRFDAWERGDLSYYRLDIEDWILSGAFGETGRLFRQNLSNLGLAPKGEIDPIWDSYLGALIGSCLHHQADKGVRIYNKWAREVGKQTLTITSHSPLEIDAKTFTISLSPEELLCINLKEMEHA